MAFMPQFAPFVVLAFLGTVLAGMLAAAVLVFGAASHKPAVRRWGTIAIVAIPAAYFALLFGASATGGEVILPHGGKKYFCEIDCHLAYSVDRVVKVKSIGAPPREARAGGEFYVISLETWFDESTISKMRPRDAPLYPNPRQVYVVDASGRRYELAEVPSTPLSRPLIPGESYVTQLVFDLPAGVRHPRLYVGDAGPVSSLLIGHEESPMHRKVWFRV